MTQQILLETKNISKQYLLNKENISVLTNINITISKGEYIAIMGQSGAGKSTLLNILACLDSASSGTYLFKGDDISKLSEAHRANIRNQEIGFVFQNFNLLPKLTVAGNVELPLIYKNVNAAERRERLRQILEKFHLWDRRKHKPNQISGGQKQRVAIARALIKKPSIIFADEPTGNLDSNTTHEILKLFDQLVNEGNTLVVVTHEQDVARRAQRILHIVDGTIAI